ncbi:MAG: DMT family transporter [Acidobacteria bacterium]|nr:DMT family transporter [Acidobacteriota bacterium]
MGFSRLQALAAAVLFSTGGAAIKMAAFSGMQVGSLRSGIAAAALLLWMRGRVVWSWQTLSVGAVYAATLTLFVASTKLTTSAHAIFLQSTAPLFIVALAPVLLRERFRSRDLGFAAVVGAGLAMCVAGRPAVTVDAPDPTLGNLLGVICGLTWALTLLGLRWGERHGAQNGMSAVVVGNVMAFAVGAPYLWPLPPASVGEWATILYLGVFQIALAYIFLTRAVARLPVLDVSLLLLLEPVLNPVWTWLARGEKPGAWTVVGGAMIVTATAVRAVCVSRVCPDRR